MGETGDFAVYIRRSTAEQDDEHQRADITGWLEQRDLRIGDADTYAEQASGADADRDDFNELIQAIEAGRYTDVVIWEISRIARKGLLAQRFFDACEDHGATVHVVNGSVRRIEPDGHGRMVADIIAAVAAEERRTLIRRTKSGIRQAKKEGKWVGQVPAGFVRVEGHLRPNLNPNYESDETGYHDIAEAIEAIENGESYRSAAAGTPNTTRQTLMNIHKDEERRAWYLDAEASDERVESAVSDLG